MFAIKIILNVVSYPHDILSSTLAENNQQRDHLHIIIINIIINTVLLYM